MSDGGQKVGKRGRQQEVQEAMRERSSGMFVGAGMQGWGVSLLGSAKIGMLVGKGASSVRQFHRHPWRGGLGDGPELRQRSLSFVRRPTRQRPSHDGRQPIVNSMHLYVNSASSEVLSCDEGWSMVVKTQLGEVWHGSREANKKISPCRRDWLSLSKYQSKRPRLGLFPIPEKEAFGC